MSDLFNAAEENPAPVSNVPEYSVSDLALSLKKTLETTYGHVRVRGELSRLTFHGSGHMYGAIKDDQATIDAICWRGTLPKLSIRPEEGMEVICTGRISSYPARSNYQLIIESMELAGEGALLKMLEERKKKLAAEGLFDAGRKKPLPFIPQKIGVITSPTGAVIRDIMHRINDRFPRPVLLWPVRVQGDTAAAEVVKAIKGFSSMKSPPDLLIIARGGGSLEDLMPFNDEALVRAIADCPIPTISAIGHETDTTLADYAADLRAPTPTGAAEMAVPRRVDLLYTVREFEQRMAAGLDRILQERGTRAENLAARLGDPSRMLEVKRQRLDIAAHRLDAGLSRKRSNDYERFNRIASRLQKPSHLAALRRQHLQNSAERMHSAAARLLPPRQEQLKAVTRMLESLSTERVLERGYTLVETSDGQIVTQPETLKSKDALNIRFAGGKKVRADVA